MSDDPPKKSIPEPPLWAYEGGHAPPSDASSPTSAADHEHVKITAVVENPSGDARPPTPEEETKQKQDAEDVAVLLEVTAAMNQVRAEIDAIEKLLG